LPRQEFDSLVEFDKLYARVVAGHENRYYLTDDNHGNIAIQQLTTSSPQFVLVLNTSKYQYGNSSRQEIIELLEKKMNQECIHASRIFWSADTS
jgi:hypothetical protein